MKNIILLSLCLCSFYLSFAQTAYLVGNRALFDKQAKQSKEERTKNDQVIPFQLLGGLIIVETEIDGLSSSCIFDTGAPTIIINKEEDLIDHTNDFGVGVTGRTKMKNRLVRCFEMGRLKMKNMKAIEIDISHIEKMKNYAIEGIIGVDAYKAQEVLIDYKKEEIQLLPKKKSKEIGTKEKIATVPFFMENQLPVIRIKIGKKSYFFGVDTGAEVNVIDTKWMKKLKKGKMQMGEEKLMTSVCANKNLVETATIEQFKIKKQSFDHYDFVFMDLSQFNQSNGIVLDGILGFPFLKDNLVSFDFRRSQLNFWKENKVETEQTEIADLTERVAMGEK